jgi:Mn-dependent DtxR family transcriptional regulator
MTVKQICEATKGARNAVWKAIKRAHAKGLVIVSGSVSLTTDGEEWLLEELETIND